ncbi:MAG: TolC family protein [Flavobacteriales bacterium]|nr:TolC family protein [Flavobacteriales bacterium]
MRKNSAVLLLVGILSTSYLHAQDSLIISEQRFLQQFLTSYPLLQVAERNVVIAELEVENARAAFDPIWYGEFGNKVLEGKDYYSYNHSSVEWNLPPGFQLRAGTDVNRGDFINPERFTPSEGLAFAELKVPLGQGLLRDEFNTYLQRARLLNERSILNLELAQREWLIIAAEAYWSWKALEEVVSMREQITALSQLRYEQTVQRYNKGAATAMDTLEAYNQVVKRKVELVTSQAEREFWYRTVGGMIWDQQLIPAYRRGGVQPDTTWTTTLSQQIPTNDQLLLHPKMGMIRFDAGVADLDFRLARENLRPKIDFKAQALSDPRNLSISSNSTIFGVSAKVPIISRKERAKFNATKIKMEQVSLKLSQAERDLMQKYDQLSTQTSLLNQSLSLVEENAVNARRLLSMEEQKLRIGESTIFLLNRRENSYIEAELKRIETQLKLRSTEWKLLMLTEEPSNVVF